jgi:hypothetical protein
MRQWKRLFKELKDEEKSKNTNKYCWQKAPWVP